MPRQISPDAPAARFSKFFIFYGLFSSFGVGSNFYSACIPVFIAWDNFLNFVPKMGQMFPNLFQKGTNGAAFVPN